MEVGDIISERREASQGGRLYRTIATEVKDGEATRWRLEVGKLLDKELTYQKEMERIEKELLGCMLVETGNHSKWEVNIEGEKVTIEELDNDGSNMPDPKCAVYNKETFLKLIKTKHFEVVTCGNRKTVTWGDLSMYEIGKYFN